MNQQLHRLPGLTRSIAFGLSLVLIANPLVWAEDAATPAAPTQQGATLTPEQLDSLVAPIALYPDELLSQILVASTYPLEIVQAYQWMQQHPNLKGQELTSAAQQQPWDPSVQALVAFPDVLKRMNQDVTWTTNLGNAFLANQTNVMDSVQKLRARAQDAGKLASSEQQKVTTTSTAGTREIVIEPANPEVVYVPDYDPVWIWGPAPVFYPYPYWYYPPRPPIGFWCWWGGAIVVSSIFIGWNGWGGWGWHPGWHNHTIFVNDVFIHSNHFNTVRVVNARGGSVWVHDPGHRMGVSYPNRALGEHFRPQLQSHFATAPVRSASQVQSQLRASAVRFNARPADRFGNRQISPGVFNRNRSAFGGIEGRAAAQAHSSRGYSSLGHSVKSGGGKVFGKAKGSGGFLGSDGGGHGDRSGGGWGGGHH